MHLEGLADTCDTHTMARSKTKCVLHSPWNLSWSAGARGSPKADWHRADDCQPGVGQNEPYCERAPKEKNDLSSSLKIIFSYSIPLNRAWGFLTASTEYLGKSSL